MRRNLNYMLTSVRILFASYSHLSGSRRSTLAPSFRPFRGLQVRTHCYFPILVMCLSPALFRRRRQLVAVIPSHPFTRTRSCKNTKISQYVADLWQYDWIMVSSFRRELPTSQHLHSWTQQEPEAGISLQHSGWWEDSNRPTTPENRVNYMPRRRRGSQKRLYVAVHARACMPTCQYLTRGYARGWSSGKSVTGHTRSRSEYHTQLAKIWVSTKSSISYSWSSSLVYSSTFRTLLVT